MELLEVIALFLGWRLDKRHEHCFYLLGPEGANIWVSDAGDRLAFHGQKPKWPSGGSYAWTTYNVPADQVGRTRISCAKNRGAFAIAKDLERRLIKNYLPMYRIAKQTVSEELKKLEELNQVTALTQRMLKGKSYLRTNRSTEPSRRLSFNGGEVELNRYRGGYMSFNLPNLSYDQGLKLAAFLSDNIFVEVDDSA